VSQQQSRPKWWAVHGTTVVINALTERKGAKVGLITTEGFRDSLEVANDGATAVVTALWRDAESYERWTSRSDRGDLADGLSPGRRR